MVKSKNRKEAEATIDRWTTGKGDFYRPVDKAKYDRNYEKAFGKKKEDKDV